MAALQTVAKRTGEEQTTSVRHVLISLGTLGDVHPFVALALELARQGHVPVLAAAEACRPIAARHGIEFHPVRPSGEQVMADTGLDEAASTRAVASDLGFVVDKVILPYAEQTVADLQPILKGADRAICSSFSILGRLAAYAAGVPVASVLLQPMALLSADDPPVLPSGSRSLLRLRRAIGPAAVRLALRLGRLGARRRFGALDRLRRELGATPLAGTELIDGPLHADRIIGLWSPAFAPAPADAPANFTLAGFTFYDGGFAGAGMSAALIRFLDAREPPIVFTLGSLAIYADDGFYAASAEAARRLARRAVLLVGEELLEKHRHLAGADTFVAGYVPHSLLFGRATAVVHHGGIGTVAQAMRAGVPQLVCPIFGDQFDNAARLERQGLGRVITKDRYTPGGVERALTALMADAKVAQRARLASLELQSEDGAAAAVAALAANDGCRSALHPNTTR